MADILPYEEYLKAGYSNKEIQDFMRPRLEEAGFSPTEVSQYFYTKSGDAKLSYMGIEQNNSVKDMAKYVADMQYKASLEGKNLNVVDAIKLGFEQSVTGMLARGQLPTELSEEQMKTLNFFERTVMGAASVISDIPVYAAGAKVGAAGGAAVGGAAGSVIPGLGTAAGAGVGSTIGGSVGAFGFHSAARQMLIDMYSRGECASWDELLYRVKNASKEFAKGGAVGAATLGAGKVAQIGKTALMGSTMARAQTALGNATVITAKAMPLGAEVLGLTSASSLVEGHVPTAQDFVDNAVLITGLKGMSLVSNYSKNKIKNKAIDYMYKKFVQEGKSPVEIVKEADQNPDTLMDMLKDSGENASKKIVKPIKKGIEVVEDFPTYSNQVKYPEGYNPDIPYDYPTDIKALPENTIASIDNAVKRTDIFNKLSEAAAIPVRLGEVRKKNVKGFYDPKAEVIRIKKAKNLKTLSHEIAHHFEKTVFGKTYSDELTNMPHAKEELVPLATKPAIDSTNGYVGEGFAQFIAMYTVNPNWAKRFAPKFYEVFEKDIGPKNPHLFKALKEARAEIQKYVEQPAIESVLSNVSNKVDENLTPKQKWEQIKYNFVTKWLDDKNPIKHMVEQVEKTTGKKLSFSENAYYQSRMFPGWSGKAEAFLENKPFEYSTLKDIKELKPLKEIISGIKNINEFIAYITSARAIELNNRKIETGIETSIAEKTIKALDKKYGKEFKNKLNDLLNYQDALLKYQKDAGLLSEKTYRDIKDKNKVYIPFERVMDQNTSAIGSKKMGSKQTIKKIKGSTRDIINPLESIIKNTFNMINAAERNRVGLAIADLSKLDKSGRFVEHLKDKKLTNIWSYKDPLDNTKNILTQSRLKDDEILVYRNGSPEIYKVDPDVARVINGYSNSIDKIEALNFLKFFTKTLRAGATGLNMAFAIKNLLRDNIFAFLSSKSGYIPFKSSIKNAKIAITKDKAYWELKKAGGSQVSFVSTDRDAMAKAIDDLTETNYLNRVWNRAKQVYDSAGKLDIKATNKNISLLLDRVLDLPSIISETSELSTRIGEFRKAMTGKEWTRENMEKAGFASREVTLDFAKGGIYSKTINQFKAFFNANLLGAEKVYNILTDKHSALKAVWSLGTLGILTALLNYDFENGREDPDIQEVLQVQKDTNWVFKMWGTDIIVRLPKPQQIGFISTMFEQMTTGILDNLNKNERDEVINNMFNAFTRELNMPTSWGDVAQTLSPTMVTPIVENWANKSMYFGTPIVPAYAEGALPEYQYNDRTTELSKAISRTIGGFIGKRNTLAPAKIENLVRGWFGGVGNFVYNIVDSTARGLGVIPNPPKPKDTLEDVAFIRSFTIRHPTGGSASVTKWYDEYEKRNELLKSYDIAGKKFDVASMETLAKYQIYKDLNPIQRELSKISANIRTIYNMPNMSADEKRQTIDSLNIVRINLAKKGLDMIRKMDKIIDSKGPEKKVSK